MAVDPAAWLILVYRLPPKPGALKPRVYRNLTAAGAVYLTAACAVAPPAGPTERAMRRTRAMIAEAGGSAVLLRANALSGGDEITAVLEGVRDREYDNIIARCGSAVTALEAMTKASDFHYQEVWKHDDELKELATACRTVGADDTRDAGKGREAVSALATYRLVLDEYAKNVYGADDS